MAISGDMHTAQPPHAHD